MIAASVSNLVEFLGLRRNTALLLGALVLAGTGERLWLGFAPKYLETLGAGVLIIGLFDALQTLLGALYAYPGGWLITTFGWEEGVRFGLLGCIVLSAATALLQWRMVEPCSSRREEAPISFREGHAEPCQFSLIPPSPSPQPSPQGRGRHFSALRSGSLSRDFSCAGYNRPLSLRERAEVRGKEASSSTETATEIGASSR